MSAVPWNENIWFSPCYVIRQLRVTMLTKDKLRIKRHKEAWICAVAIICYSKIDPTEWWIQIPKIDPPDVLAMKIVPNDRGLGQDILVTPIEVFELREYDSSENIYDSVERKLAGKDYSGMVIIGYVRRMEIFDHEEVAERIKKLNPDVSAVFLLVSEESNTNYSFISLFPHCIKLKYDFKKFCEFTSQGDFVRMSRSVVIRSESISMVDTLTLFP